MIHVNDKMKFLTENNLMGVTKKKNGKEVIIGNYRNKPLEMETPVRFFGG